MDHKNKGRKQTAEEKLKRSESLRKNKYEELKELTELEKAYIAGIFDGEGCIGIYSYSYRCFIQLSVSNTNEKLIDFLFSKLTGNISKEKTPKKDGWKKECKWKSGYFQAYEILKILQPYLILKKEQADICIDFYKKRHLLSFEEQLEYKLKTQELNKKGVSI